MTHPIPSPDGSSVSEPEGTPTGLKHPSDADRAVSATPALLRPGQALLLVLGIILAFVLAVLAITWPLNEF